MAKINIINLTHTYNKNDKNEREILKNINLDIEKGEFVVLLGESGCGKTTFLNAISGILKPTTGFVLVDNKKINGPHHSRSFIFQQPCLLPWLNVRENILFGCKIRKDRQNISKRYCKYLELMGLAGVEKIFPDDLSYGMAQRVAFARALIGMPEILLLDEPFTALDFLNRTRLQSELIRTWLFEHYTIIFVTHDIDEAILLGQKIVLLGNSPARIEKTFDVKYKYPRDLNKKELFELKLLIQDEFEKLIKNKITSGACNA